MKIESNSSSIETDGLLWHFIRVGKIELFINGPEGAISIPWGDCVFARARSACWEEYMPQIVAY